MEYMYIEVSRRKNINKDTMEVLVNGKCYFMLIKQDSDVVDYVKRIRDMENFDGIYYVDTRGLGIHAYDMIKTAKDNNGDYEFEYVNSIGTVLMN